MTRVTLKEVPRPFGVRSAMVGLGKADRLSSLEMIWRRGQAVVRRVVNVSRSNMYVKGRLLPLVRWIKSASRAVISGMRRVVAVSLRALR